MEYPKVELHCHMDGAIPNRLFVKYCREDGLLDETISDEEWIRKHVMSETMTLSECMGEFALLTNLLQSEERLEELSFELLKDMYESGTKLVELRFSPQSHVNDHMTMEQAVQAVLRGRKKALEVYPDLVCGFLLCMMNLGQDLGTIENNTRTILLARKYKKDGVVGIDLAGDECATPIEGYAPQFELAKRLGVNYTIHAIEDDKVVDELVAKGFLLEGSVTSNVFSQCVPSLDEHPIRKLWDRGVMININTDDPGLMGISLSGEYEKIAKHFGFKEREFILSNLYSARASFCEGKERIIAELTKALGNCD